MQYRRVPKNGDQLSALGFGAMRLPLKADGSIDDERAINQIRYTIDHGVNYIDTAWTYHMGQSELVVGRALADGYRDKVKLATKLPSWLIESREDMDKFLTTQLEKLNTDHIDYYLIHCLNGDLWNKAKDRDIAGFLDVAKADDRIKSAGFSFHGDGKEFPGIIDTYDWDFCQIQYNFLDEKNQAGTAGLKYAAKKGLAVIVMEPLRGGNLTRNVPDAVQEIWDEAQKERTPAEWALRWVWDHPEVTVVLSGMNDEAHISENIRITDQALPGSLSRDELHLIKRVEQKYRELMKVGCTGCRYCMPCPNGVNIPICFEFYNNMYLSGKPDAAKIAYVMAVSPGLMYEKGGFASQCVQCGECVEKCPQKINIPDVLGSVVEEFEGPGLEQRIAMGYQYCRSSRIDR
jgi:predicted aldo/keto reductase-like oxidoreductase